MSVTLTTAGTTTAPVETERAIATLVLAFADDPILRWLFPDASRYTEAFPSVLRLLGDGATPHGTVDLVEDGAGAAIWHRPVRAAGSRWRNEVLAKPSQPAARVRPVRAARHVRCPLFVSLGTEDTIVPARPIQRAARRAPRGELYRYPIGHFDGFLDHFETVADDQIAFLTRHLRDCGPAD